MADVTRSWLLQQLVPLIFHTNVLDMKEPGAQRLFVLFINDEAMQAHLQLGQVCQNALYHRACIPTVTVSCTAGVQ